MYFYEGSLKWLYKMNTCVVLQYTLSKPNSHLEDFSAYSIVSFFYKLVLLCYFRLRYIFPYFG